jgi:large subunit ribosomal protein L17
VIPPAPAPAADDLVIIEGIGPKIASLLQENGITTFEQLGNADLSALHAILKEAGLGFTDPSSWPEQAKLAAKADWTALEDLQGRLKGGRG